MKIFFLLLFVVPVSAKACTSVDMIKVSDEIVSKMKAVYSMQEVLISDMHIRDNGKEKIFESILYIKATHKDGKEERTASLITAKMENGKCKSLKPFFSMEMKHYPGF